MKVDFCYRKPFPFALKEEHVGPNERLQPPAGAAAAAPNFLWSKGGGSAARKGARKAAWLWVCARAKRRKKHRGTFGAHESSEHSLHPERQYTFFYDSWSLNNYNNVLLKYMQVLFLSPKQQQYQLLHQHRELLIRCCWLLQLAVAAATLIIYCSNQRQQVFCLFRK